MFQWLLENIWVEAAILGVGVLSVYLAFHTQSVVELKAVALAGQPGASPQDQAKADHELLELGFEWTGDFSTNPEISAALRMRAYVSANRLHHAVLVQMPNQFEQLTMVEFGTALPHNGGISTNNNKQPGIYSYRLQKQVVRAPWKRTLREIFTLHQALCDAAYQCGFAPQVIPARELCSYIAADSRMDIEGERARGRMCLVSTDTYRTTFKGALIYTPRIWFKMWYGCLYSWYKPGDKILVERARRRFERAALRIAD